MRLSDAILAGSTSVGTSKPYDSDTCALAMAGSAVGEAIPARRLDAAFDYDPWGWLSSYETRSCPRCKLGELPGMLVAHIFDEHVIKGEMTLEQLVDYVRLIEPAEELDYIDPRDEEPWSDTQTRLEQMNSIKGR